MIDATGGCFTDYTRKCRNVGSAISRKLTRNSIDWPLKSLERMRMRACLPINAVSGLSADTDLPTM